jgi:hypothetical protein
MYKRSQRSDDLLADAATDSPPGSELPSEPVRVCRATMTTAPDEEILVDCCFAIFPDETPPGARARPIAIFDTLEDAMDWALQRFKGGAFRLRYERFVLVDDELAAQSAQVD